MSKFETGWCFQAGVVVCTDLTGDVARDEPGSHVAPLVDAGDPMIDGAPVEDESGFRELLMHRLECLHLGNMCNRLL